MDLFNILMLLYSSTEDIESQRLIMQRIDLLCALIKLESQTDYIEQLLQNRPSDIRAAAVDVETCFNEIIASRPDSGHEIVNNLPERKQALLELIDNLLISTYNYFLASDLESDLIMTLPPLSTLHELSPII